jgi:hypothetical protein
MRIDEDIVLLEQHTRALARLMGKYDARKVEAERSAASVRSAHTSQIRAKALVETPHHLRAAVDLSYYSYPSAEAFDEHTPSFSVREYANAHHRLPAHLRFVGVDDDGHGAYTVQTLVDGVWQPTQITPTALLPWFTVG